VKKSPTGKNHKRHLFGTDGVRGVANVEPMTSEMALKLGRAIAYVLPERNSRSAPARVIHRIASSSDSGQESPKHRYKVIIGKDTRLSGYLLETALASGICSMGVDVQLVGPLPTPGVAFLTRSMRADAGVVISASHNPFQDNGIKFFSHDGFKLPDALEARMEEAIADGKIDRYRPTAAEIGKAFRISDAVGRYIVFLKNSFPRRLTLDGLKIVIDCGHGAAYRVAPAVLSELGAEVIAIGVQPDGENINRDCGSLHPETARRLLLEHGADLGIALDGDSDRAVFIDERGEVVDGDEVLAICAKEMIDSGTLKSKAIVATIMSNLGLDIALKGMGGTVIRTAVGDRYVVEEMLRGDYNLGGEQSGHIVFLDVNTTGDGCLTFLQILAIMLQSEKTLGELKRVMTKLPQVLTNVPVREKKPLHRLPKVRERIARVEKELGDRGRVLVRYSGTESLARVMLEGEDQTKIQAMAEEIADEIRIALGNGTVNGQ
jgi:phosphoglucosamine mutase